MMKTTNVHVVEVIQVHDDHALCSWNGNRPRKYFDRDLAKLKVKKPVMVDTFAGGARLATLAEKKEAQAKGLLRESGHRILIQRPR